MANVEYVMNILGFSQERVPCYVCSSNKLYAGREWDPIVTLTAQVQSFERAVDVAEGYRKQGLFVIPARVEGSKRACVKVGACELHVDSLEGLAGKIKKAHEEKVRQLSAITAD